VRVYAFHDQSGCGEYRVKVPLGAMAEHGGHDVRMVLGSNVEHAEMRDYELIVGQRMDKHAALPEWRRMRSHSRLVYEIDDDVFSVDPVNAMAYVTFSRADVQDAVAHAAEVADLVTVTTPTLAEVMRRHNPNVVVLPNYVPDYILDTERPKRDKVVIGWAGGASHGSDLQMIAAQLRRVIDRNDVETHLVGTDYEDTIGRPCRFTKWDPDLATYYSNIDFDIGLAPLTTSVFNRSKSHIKALEYAALGIPVVATDLETYRDFVVDGVTGWLVKREHEWFKRVHALVNDEAMRTEMAANARSLASKWTITNGWKQWEDAYQKLLG